MTKSSAH